MGVESLFPAAMSTKRPRMLYQSYFRGEYVSMNKGGRRRMLFSIVITVASVWKHPKSQYWTACFRDQNGRQRRISTKETNNSSTLLIDGEHPRGVERYFWLRRRDQTRRIDLESLTEKLDTGSSTGKLVFTYSLPWLNFIED